MPCMQKYKHNLWLNNYLVGVAGCITPPDEALAIGVGDSRTFSVE